MKYQANPVLVDALSIVSVGTVTPDGTPVVLDNDMTVTLSPEMTARMQPQPGDYLVTQADGYNYINPKAVFERKYSPVAS